MSTWDKSKIFFVPFGRVTLQTKMPPSEVYALLAPQIEDVRWGWDRRERSGRAFLEGTLVENPFEHVFWVTRVIHYRNDFKPYFWGRIEWQEEGTVIHITLRPRIMPLVVFGIVFSSFIFGPVFGIIANGVGSIQANDAFALVPMLMMFVFYSVILTLFNYEARLTLNFLQSLLEE